MAINLTSKLDYKVIDQKERIKLVKKILEEKNENKNEENKKLSEEIDDYFENNFNPHPKCGEHGDILSHDDKMCQQLDAVANYILFCPGALRITKKTEYNFYTEKQFEEQEKNKPHIECMIDKINNKHNNYESTISPMTGNEVIDYLKRKGNNYKKEIKQVISKKDLIDPELKVVKEYQDYIDSLKSLLDKLRKEKRNKKLQYKLINNMKFCKTDQIYCKDAIKGTIYFKEVLPDTTDIDYDQFDFFDKEHVLCLLKFEPMNLTTDLGILVYDLNQLLKKIKLTKTEQEVLRYHRQINDKNQEEIAKELGFSQQYIASVLDRLADKITKKFEEVYEDWYYLNLVRGKYKKCSCCGKIKLANERYFSPDSTRKDGFFPYCKKCNK